MEWTGHMAQVDNAQRPKKFLYRELEQSKRKKCFLGQAP